ncbi:MAG: serine/threonine-protein kinase [Phycisphaerales bacterium]
MVATAGLSGPERRAEIERLCGGDSELKAAVMRLVHLDERASCEESTTSDSAARLATTDEARPVPRLLDPNGLPTPESIGRYRILDVIGEGGFGVVYRAEQSEPVRRQVALKVIKPGMDSKAVVGRFEAERQALALMDHPGVAKVFDGGTTDQGRPFFAMELVKGEPITTHCDRHKLGVRARVELFIRVCEAVQHAHHKGVVHRDLKPSNILVQYEGGKASPKVIDFGVAKALNQRLTEATIFTGQGQMIGTPEYMSPEQAEMSGTDIDTRSDVYSLGVLLYELLTGQRYIRRHRSASPRCWRSSGSSARSIHPSPARGSARPRRPTRSRRRGAPRPGRCPASSGATSTGCA